MISVRSIPAAAVTARYTTTGRPSAAQSMSARYPRITPLRSSRASRSATAGGDISICRARARCDCRESAASARSSARSKSSTSTSGLGGGDTSASLANGAGLIVIWKVAYRRDDLDELC